MFFIGIGTIYASEIDSNGYINETNTDKIIKSNNDSINLNFSNNSSSKINSAKSNLKVAGEPTELTQKQILITSKTVNSYINKYKKLPNYVTISGYKYSMPEYLYLLSMTISNKYNKKSSSITIKYNIKDPTKPTGNSIKGKISKLQYYTYSKNMVNYIQKYNKIPNYLTTKLGKMQYQTVIYSINKLIYYSETHNGNLPSTLSLNIAKTHTINKNIPKYNKSQNVAINTGSNSKTISQSLIWATSTNVKNYLDKNKKLPDYVTISGYKYSMPEYLYLLSKAINTKVSGSSANIIIKNNIKNPTNASGATISKIFTKAQYNDMAKRIVAYIISNNKAPNYLSAKYGAGNIQYQTIIYGMTYVGNYINVKKSIPSSLSIKIANNNPINKYLPIYSINSNNNSNNITNNTNHTNLSTKLLGANDKGKVELIGIFGNANSKIKIAYVIGLHPLESSVHSALYNSIVSKNNNLKYCYYIYNITVTKDASDYDKGRMNGQLLTQEFVLPHILNQNYNLVIDVHSNKGTQNGGAYEKTNFIFAPLNHPSSKKIAESIINQISELVYYYPTSQTSPPYLTNHLVNAEINTIIYETYIYEDLATTNSLINQLITKIDNYFSESKYGSTSTISLADIIDASSRIKTYVEINGNLPSYVIIDSTEWSMPKFLYLVSTAIVKINENSSSNIQIIEVNPVSNPNGDKIAGILQKSDYLDLASRVSTYILNNKRVPNYASSILGNIQYQSLIYELSKILNYYKNNGTLPNSLSINTSYPPSINNDNSNSEVLSNDLKQYLKSTIRCQVNDDSIQSLAKKLTTGLTTDLEKATAIFNYVRDKISYSFYYNSYDSTGAKGVISKGWGNCVDKTHLLIALLRAIDIPARYVHGNCYFTGSKQWIGHVWGEIYIDGKWVFADTTSSTNKLGIINNWNVGTYTLKGTYTELSF
ncbi:MAG: pseudomurein-binding repeat-containing protein [Methanobacteriaceae archaeon]